MHAVEELVETSTKSANLTSGKLLVRNTIWNGAGSCAPMLVAIFCIPILVRGLGKERFGVLTLAWALIGYASLFDFGLGRALTQIVSTKLGNDERRQVPALAWTSLALMLLLGMICGSAMAICSPLLVRRALNIPPNLQVEALHAFYWLAVSVPAVICTAGLRGLLEAHQRFELTNILRIPMGAFTFLGPVLVLSFARSLVPVVATLVIGRFVVCCAFLLVCMRVVHQFGNCVTCERSAIAPLLRFGGWMTVTNLISPLLVTVDRFFIGAMVSMTAVAYYATPYEVVTKFLLIPGALMGVMFPAFTTTFVDDRERTVRLFGRSLKFLSLVLFPAMLTVVVLAHDGLRLWLGADFAQHSFRVLQWLAVGVFINSLAQVPFTFIQGAGRPDLTARLHLVELPIYLVMLWWMVRTHGFEGAALAWSARVALDALVLFVFARRLLPGKAFHRPRLGVLGTSGLLSLAVSTLPNSLVYKTMFLVLTILGFIVLAWFRVLSPEERRMVQNCR